MPPRIEQAPPAPQPDPQTGQAPKTGSLTSLKQGTTDSGAVQSYYDEWADNYDATLAEWQYSAPDDACDLLVPHLAGGAHVLDVGCGTGLLGRALGKRGRFAVDGIDISAESLARAVQRQCYAELIRHDLQVLPLPVQANRYDAATIVGVLSYIEDAEALMRDLCRCVRSGGMITFTQRTDFWAARHFAEMIARLERDGLWIAKQTTPPMPYMPGHADFADEIKVIHSLCRVA